jgi:hypothetical protein
MARMGISRFDFPSSASGIGIVKLSFTLVSTLSIFLVPPAFSLAATVWLVFWSSGLGRPCAGRAPAGEAKFKFNPLGAFRCV